MKTNSSKSVALFFCDNGRLLCSEHLGATAKATGRDISGQRIMKLNEAARAELVALGCSASCETCGAELKPAAKRVAKPSVVRTSEVLYVADMPADVQARAALMGWTCRVVERENGFEVAGSWGRNEDDALAKMLDLRRRVSQERNARHHHVARRVR
jgi:hypothetical protein